MEIKDKVKLQDGTEVEVTIVEPGYLERNEVFRLAIQTGMSGGATNGSFDMFRLQSEAIKRFVKGCDINRLSYKSGDYLFNKYFQEAFNMGDASGNSSEISED
ncbi:MAG: hypothetical protein EOL97_12850 [Spirochaetia bacterium]|nr:hypothetical protein [Spirochaetia bacterium]